MEVSGLLFRLSDSFTEVSAVVEQPSISSVGHDTSRVAAVPGVWVLGLLATSPDKSSWL